MGKKDDLYNFRGDMAVGDRLYNVSGPDLLRFFFPLKPSPGFTENGPESREYSATSNSLGKNTLLMPEDRGEWPDCSELIVSNHF